MAAVNSGMMVQALRLAQPLIRGVKEHPFHPLQPGGTIGVKWGAESEAIKQFYGFEAIWGLIIKKRSGALL